MVGWANDPLQEEPFPGPDNQSKMKRSVESAEHVGTQLLTIDNNDRQLTLTDLGLFTPTAGLYFRDEQRRRHSQYDGGLACESGHGHLPPHRSLRHPIVELGNYIIVSIICDIVKCQMY